jgi:hypothetical protein
MMRYLLIVFFLLAVTANSIAQTFICDSLSPKADPKLYVAAVQLRECLEEIDDIEEARKLVDVLNLNAIKYFDLARLFDSEEKLNAFKSSKAYKDTLAALTKIKEETLNTYYYSVLTTNPGKFQWSFKGYKFDMDKLTTPGGVIGAPPPPTTMFYAIDLSALPFAITSVSNIKESGPDQSMMLPVEPDNGMKIDRDKENARFIVVYKLDHVTQKEYQYYNEQCHCNRNAKENVIVTKFNRVIVFNIQTNEVYSDKTF